MQGSRSVFGRAPLEARHQPSGLNAAFEGDGLSFADYVARSRDMLLKAHSAAADLDKIVAGNAPFELKPTVAGSAGVKKAYRRGVLLTHGLTDSPYCMRHLAAFFQDNGFRVMAILLPGHGTQPGDLLDMRWQEWGRAVAYGADRLDKEVDELYLAGFSAGGALSVYQSLCDERVRGLFLFSPALRITPLAVLANLHRLYSWLITSGKWLDIQPDHDIYKYESFPKNAAAQMRALIQALNARLQAHQLDIPIFAAASADDVTVDTSATVGFIAHSRHPSSRLVLYSTVPEEFSSDIPAERLEWVNSALPGQRILSSAHTAIMLPAEDRHYGAAGEYASCTHYYPGKMEKYAVCKNDPAACWQGELTRKNLNVGVLRRLRYNPNFTALQISMRRFIDKL